MPIKVLIIGHIHSVGISEILSEMKTSSDIILVDSFKDACKDKNDLLDVLKESDFKHVPIPILSSEEKSFLELKKESYPRNKFLNKPRFNYKKR